MDSSNNKIEFSGEFFVPGKTDSRIAEDHMERYLFACQFAQDKSILDIACGMGYSSKLFIDAGAISYHGVDINKDLINLASDTYTANNIKFEVGDITTYDVDKLYDIITCFETIEHVSSYDTAISNLNSLLKPGGILLITSPNRIITSPSCINLNDIPSNKYHTQEFVPKELLAILNSHGFKADTDNLYGQRQRKKVYKNKYIRKMIYLIFGNMDVKTSPKVTKVTNKIPRYFLIFATKNNDSH